MEKRGQVTIFIILGIIVIAILGFILYTQGIITGGRLNEAEAQQLVSAQVEPVKEHIKTCVKRELIRGVHLVSVQGGYLDPAYYEVLGARHVSYACIGGATEFPLLSVIEVELEKYMALDEARGNIEDCIDGFKFFKDTGLSVSHDFSAFVVSRPEILQDRVRQEFRYPVTISKQEASANINELGFVVDSNLAAVYKVASDVVIEECGEGNFDIGDYFWFQGREEVLPCSIEAGHQARYDMSNYAQAWYLKSFKPEEDGEPLKFHFMVEQ